MILSLYNKSLSYRSSTPFKQKNLLFYFFQADLVVLMHNWFPWSHCLRNLMIRTYSLSTYDSVIYRRTTMLNRQTSFNNNSCSSKSIKATTTLNGSARPMRKLHRVGTEVRTNKSNIPVRKFSSIQYKHRLPSSDEQPWHLIFSVNLFFIIISKNDNVNIEERCFKKNLAKLVISSIVLLNCNEQL